MLSVRQSVFVVPAVVEVARREGLFAAAGLDVSTATVPSSTAQRHDLDAGVADLAITATDNLLAWNADGSDIAVVAQIETTTDLALMLRPGLRSIEEPRRRPAGRRCADERVRDRGLLDDGARWAARRRSTTSSRSAACASGSTRSPTAASTRRSWPRRSTSWAGGGG